MKLNERFKHGYEFTIETGEKYFIAEIDVESTRVDYWCYPVSIKDKLEKHPTFTHDDIINEQHRIILNESQLYELALLSAEKKLAAQKISVKTPLGILEATVGGDTECYPEIFTYLVRPDGLEIDLVAVEVKKEDKFARAYLYGDTTTDQYTKTHDWSQDDINVEVD